MVGDGRTRMRDRIIAVLICVSMVILCGCGGNNETVAEPVAETVQEDQSSVSTGSDTAAEKPVQTEEKEPEEMEPALPEGQYRLAYDRDKEQEAEYAYYQVGDTIKPGLYHLEECSDDFRCFTIIKDADYVTRTETQKVLRKTEYCVKGNDQSDPRSEETIMMATNGAVSVSGIIMSGREPEIVDDETQMVLTTDQMFIVCVSGSARLVFDAEYDAAKMAEIAQLPDFGAWDDRDYTNEGLGIHLQVPFNREHMNGWRTPGKSIEKEYYDSEYIRKANAPDYIDVYDEVATKIIGISSYSNSSLSVFAFDTAVPVGAIEGDTFYEMNPEKYVKRLVEEQNQKAKEDPDHYSEAEEMDDQIFGHEAKMITLISNSDTDMYMVGPDADYVTTYESVWAYQQDRYLVVTKLKFSFGQMDIEKEGAEDYNRAQFDECMEIVNDILPEL